MLDLILYNLKIVSNSFAYYNKKHTNVIKTAYLIQLNAK